MIAVLMAVVAGLWLSLSGCAGDGGSTVQTAGSTSEAPAAGPDQGSPFGFHPASVSQRGYAASGFQDAESIGVGWSREGVYAFWFLIQPDLSRPEYDFSLYDRQWGAVPEGMNILANLAPQPREDKGRLVPGTWQPVDEASYRGFVIATVERYDGDGIDDMPGLKNPITYWQVGNEPDESRRQGFAALQRLTYEAVKAACPDCQVMIGGVPGMPGGYIESFDKNYAPILAELGGCCVDVFDFHWYGNAAGDYRFRDAATGEDVVGHIRDTLAANGFSADMPLWITEMGSYSGDPADQRFANPPQSERQQAGDYFRRFIFSFSRGVEKVFPAFGLIEGFKHDNGYFDNTGLFYNGEGPGDPGVGVKKLSYYSYKKMTAELEGADWSTLELLSDGTDGSNVWLFKLERGGESVWIAWWDYFDEPGYSQGDTKGVTISGLAGAEAAAVPVVPAAPSGAAVTDYATAFPPAVYPVEGGTATISLGEDPVIITGR